MKAHNNRPRKKGAEFLNIYGLPGDGLVAELKIGAQHQLFDRQGLQHRIVTGKKQAVDTSAEETALAQINALSRPHSFI